MTWDYSRSAYAVYQNGSLIIVQPGAPNIRRRVCHWWRYELTRESPPLSAYLDQLGLTLVPRWQSWPEQLELI